VANRGPRPQTRLALPIAQVLDEPLGAFGQLQGGTVGLFEGESTPPQVGQGALIDARLSATHEEPVQRGKSIGYLLGDKPHGMQQSVHLVPALGAIEVEAS
jgi:hypothetical protein